MSVKELNLSLSALHTGKTHWTTDLLRQFILLGKAVWGDNMQRRGIKYLLAYNYSDFETLHLKQGLIPK